MRTRLAIGAVLIAALAMTAAPAAGRDHYPLEHIVVVMQEDRTFDHYFGTYPGADGWPAGYSMPVDPARPELGSVRPHKLTATRTPSLPHSSAAMKRAFNEGAMDSFVVAADEFGASDGTLALGYYDSTELPFYWYLADEYVLADRWFSSVMGPSFPNHLYLFAASMRGPDGQVYSSVPAEGLDIYTIFDRLEEEGVSWKVYAQGYDPESNFRNTEARLGLTDKGAQLVWLPLVGIPRFVDDPVLNSKIVDLSEFYVDADAGTLPQFSIIAPSGLSEHPPGDLTLGHYFATDLIESLMMSPNWWSSALILTWDEWGGWADHVPPPQVDEDGYGMRVPGLIVSPYAKRGFVDSTTYDHTSPLALVEEVYGVEPIAERDRNANNLLNAFDFDQEPRSPVIPPPEYVSPDAPQEPPPDPSRVSRLYEGLLAMEGVLVLLVFGGGWLTRLLRRER